MCLILYTPEGTTFPMYYLDNVYENNKQGFGMMWLDDNRQKIHSIKGVFSKAKVKELIENGPKHKVAYHFRFTTRGATNEENAHPFKIHDKLFMMHNGTLDIKTLGSESDTQAFSKVFSDLDEAVNTDYFLNKETQKSVAELIGSSNRMLFMGYNKDGHKTVNFVGGWYRLKKNRVYVSNTYSLREPFYGRASGSMYGNDEYDWEPVKYGSNNYNDKWKKWRDRWE